MTKVCGLLLWAAFMGWSSTAVAQEAIPPCTADWRAANQPALEAETWLAERSLRRQPRLASGRSGVMWTESNRRSSAYSRMNLYPATVQIARAGNVLSEQPLSLAERVRLPKRPGRYEVRATWAEAQEVGYDQEGSNLFGPPCFRTETAQIQVIRGRLPKVRVAVKPYAVEFKVVDQGKAHWQCEESRKVGIRVTVRGPDSTRTLRLSNVCGKWSKARRGNDWRLSKLSNYRYDVDPFPRGSLGARPTAQFDATYTHKRRFSWRVTVGRRVAGRGGIESYRGRRIWWEEDAYVNICINRLRPVWSEGGRLYCYAEEPKLRPIRR